MRLTDYLAAKETTPTDFARQLGVTPSIITRLLRNERGVSLKIAIRIEQATDGQVPVHELLREKQEAAE